MKQVRRKFVLYAMLAVFVLLLTILTIINGTNFTMAASDADAVTAMLAEKKGKFDEAPEGAFFISRKILPKTKKSSMFIRKNPT